MKKNRIRAYFVPNAAATKFEEMANTDWLEAKRQLLRNRDRANTGTGGRGRRLHPISADPPA